MSRDDCKIVLVLVLVAGIVIVESAPSNAAPITMYTNQADFLLASPTNLLVEFPPVDHQSGVFVFDNGTLRGQGGPLVWGFIPGSSVSPRPTTPWAAVAGDDDFQWSFTIPVAAMAFDLVTNSTAQETVLFFDTTDQLIQSINIDALTAPNTAQFLGFSSTTPINRVVLNTSGGASQDEGIDDFFIANVPEPGTLVLLSIGGLLWICHRRR